MTLHFPWDLVQSFEKGLEDPLNLDLAQLSALYFLSPAQLPSHLLSEIFPTASLIQEKTLSFPMNPTMQCTYTSDIASP